MLLITRLNRFLNDLDFPMMRDEILAVAIESNVEDDVINELADLPFDIYNSRDEVLEIVSKKQSRW